eukprot:scaffold93080_cov61-Phaeocystis_antarctica.AAC.1
MPLLASSLEHDRAIPVVLVLRRPLGIDPLKQQPVERRERLGLDRVVLDGLSVRHVIARRKDAVPTMEWGGGG